jgi:long-chain fatty acid transport protein
MAPVPVIGVVGRISTDDEPSRVTLAAGLWNTFGGSTSYPKTGMPALDTTQDLCIELDAGASLRISDRLSVGASARLGVGFFHVATTMDPFDSDLSSSGVGVGFGVGALFRPTDNVRIGLNWRSPLHVPTEGSGTVTTTGAPQQHDISHEQNWPQSVQLGLGVATSPRVKLAAQVDFTQWSQTETIEVHFPGGGLPDQIFKEYWEDSWTFRLGGEYAVSSSFQLRAGGYYDTPAVPDLSLERQYSDSHKFGVSLGTSVHAGAWRIDFAADGIIPRNRHVPNNADDVMGISALENKAPGDYIGSLITFEAAAARAF